MFIDQVISADSVPTLAAAAKFAAQRHKILLSNVANITTPGYQTQDVSVRGFQEQLAEAVQRRREGGPAAQLEIQSTDEVRMAAGTASSMTLTPKARGTNVLFHDRNDRDLERAMQNLAENAAAFRLATDLLKNRMSILETAIRERF